MKRLVLAVALIGTVTAAIAQDSLVGSWSGSFQFPGLKGRGGPVMIGVALNIASAEDGVAKGTATLSSIQWPCAGDYPMEGKYEESKLSMRATAKGGRYGDCSFRVDVVREGNRLTGTTGTGWSLQLSR